MTHSFKTNFEKALWASDAHYLTLGEKAVAIWAAAGKRPMEDTTFPPGFP